MPEVEPFRQVCRGVCEIHEYRSSDENEYVNVDDVSDAFFIDCIAKYCTSEKKMTGYVNNSLLSV
jgi:hypothetical protein